jgi:hypothetical protein
MNSVCSNQDIALNLANHIARLFIDEFGSYLLIGTFKSGQVVAGDECARSETLDDRIAYQQLQVSAVDRELRPFEAGIKSTRIGQNYLPALGQIFHYSGFDPGRGQPVTEPEVKEGLGAMWQQIDPGAKGFNTRCGFVYRDVHAQFVEREGCR